MSYVNSLRAGTPVTTIHEALVASLYRQHAEDGPGRKALGMIPGGKALIYEQAFDSESSQVTVMHRGEFIPLFEADTADVCAALVVIDRKIARHGLV